MENKFNHFDNEGNAIMVDVGNKNATERIAIASGKIRVNRDTFLAIEQGTAKKGDVLGVARVAGIMAAKKTSELIPLCHPLMITNCTIDFELLPKTLEVEVTSKVKVTGNTGVEMEALTAVSTTLLTIYDMCKAIDKAMEIGNIHLRRKIGGKSGDFINK
ncbi:cyclic pyranopterin monophosphate synthase MoaC [Clostridium botulinum]|uniref:cyclic pyranopterin monophosphate synthase MoaC n=1 Tax=unclassified Clostridium TaxID=2614128 RepID=UPI0013C96DC8|nr:MULTISPECIES: cyclic pyranopterin monophosphate synthase MoaC [unclassified Clostridium]NFH99634.1 cyclic pyranopterin monophosphate synthase MoaC [Clostridium botulinum]NFI62031.1 cyclic pyranopterin monophosphate synthase MoaC [Clostridium botulinum]NFJ42763.1 cyclic pyranopterin monophosphate synthase MoaC [Clostridium botulinum]NFJ46366.1 cyclic pyranopterin monophosphate synthase MoaC [Clostridium botulinum]NFK24752.1 cyclic pyranopterin monophosphate synthase MoaC [Clostridium botulin